MSLAENLPPDESWIPEDTFGARLALIRQRKGWNVKEAAEHCGLGVQSWRNWEMGKSPRGFEEVAQRISDATGCNRTWLLVGGSAVPRNRWFSPLTLVSDLPGQMALPFGERPTLELV